MKAAFITRTGPPEVISVGELPDPVPGLRQALVRVRDRMLPLDSTAEVRRLQEESTVGLSHAVGGKLVIEP